MARELATRYWTLCRAQCSERVKTVAAGLRGFSGTLILADLRSSGPVKFSFMPQALGLGSDRPQTAVTGFRLRRGQSNVARFGGANPTDCKLVDSVRPLG